MQDINILTLTARLATQPEVVQLGNERHVVECRIASTRSYLNRTTNEWVDDPTFITAKIYGNGNQRGLVFADKARVGDSLTVTGRLAEESWGDEGNRRSRHILVVENITGDWQFLTPEDANARPKKSDQPVMAAASAKPAPKKPATRKRAAKK